jgi:hypothetical protein
MPSNRSSKRGMSDEHKASLALGRTEGRAVRRYVEALRASSPRRGRQRTAATIERRLAAIDEELPQADSMRQLKLVQERRDLTTELASMGDAVDIEELEDAFVEIAASYSARQGIGYQSWREVGVPAGVLARAGINRSR